MSPAEAITYAAVLSGACAEVPEATDYGTSLDDVRQKHSAICNPALQSSMADIAREHLALAVAALNALAACPHLESLERLPDLEELEPV